MPKPFRKALLSTLAAAVARFRGTERLDAGAAASGETKGVAGSAWVLADRFERLGRRASR